MVALRREKGFSVVLRYVAEFCDVLWSIMVCCGVLRFVAGIYGVCNCWLLWCVAGYYCVLRGNMLCCEALWCVAGYYSVLRDTLVRCEPLWCVVRFYNITLCIMARCQVL